ncbi:MAG: ComF family protein [Clostridiales bacterium]|nr:ComF family protein [Clostridiales bacterium]
MKFKEVFSLFLDALYPPRCLFCGTVISPGERLCELCEQENPMLHQSRWILLPSPYQDEKIECKVIYHYKNGVKEAILDFKFHDKPENSSFFAEKMNESVMESYNTLHIDFITAVPISRERRKERGYNQSELLAKQLVKQKNLIYVPCLEKKKDNFEQHKLSAKDRKENVIDVYECVNCEMIKGKTVLLIDDIVTTGYTLAECAKTLYEAGAKKVVCAAIATSAVENSDFDH